MSNCGLETNLQEIFLQQTENFAKQISSSNLTIFILTKVNANKSVLWSHCLYLIQIVIFILASSDSQTEDWIGIASGMASGISDVSSPGSWKAAVAVAQRLEPYLLTVQCWAVWVCQRVSVPACELSNQDCKHVFLILSASQIPEEIPYTETRTVIILSLKWKHWTLVKAWCCLLFILIY